MLVYIKFDPVVVVCDLISPLFMAASLLSEKIHSSSKEYNVDVVQEIRRDEDAPIRPINPRVLKRATLKTDFYLIPILGMFRELYLVSCPFTLSLISHTKIYCLF